MASPLYLVFKWPLGINHFFCHFARHSRWSGEPLDALALRSRYNNDCIKNSLEARFIEQRQLSHEKLSFPAAGGRFRLAQNPHARMQDGFKDFSIQGIPKNPLAQPSTICATIGAIGVRMQGFTNLPTRLRVVIQQIRNAGVGIKSPSMQPLDQQRSQRAFSGGNPTGESKNVPPHKSTNQTGKQDGTISTSAWSFSGLSFIAMPQTYSISPQQTILLQEYPPNRSKSHPKKIF